MFGGRGTHLRGRACLQVPNQTLMGSDIINVTQSRSMVDRITFEVDMPEMKPELCEQLAGRVLRMMKEEKPRRLFSADFVPNSYIVGVTNPLKYMVRFHVSPFQHHTALQLHGTCMLQPKR